MEFSQHSSTLNTPRMQSSRSIVDDLLQISESMQDLKTASQQNFPKLSEWSTPNKLSQQYKKPYPLFARRNQSLGSINKFETKYKAKCVNKLNIDKKIKVKPSLSNISHLSKTLNMFKKKTSYQTLFEKKKDSACRSDNKRKSQEIHSMDHEIFKFRSSNQFSKRYEMQNPSINISKFLTSQN